MHRVKARLVEALRRYNADFGELARLRMWLPFLHRRELKHLSAVGAWIVFVDVPTMPAYYPILPAKPNLFCSGRVISATLLTFIIDHRWPRRLDSEQTAACGDA